MSGSIRTARRAGTNAAATPTTAVTAAMATSATGSMFGRYTSMLPIPMSADPGVARSAKHDQDREDETDAGRHADQPRHPSVDTPDHLLTPGIAVMSH